MVNELQNALEVLRKALIEDEGYRIGWQSNIAMAYKDNENWYKQKNNKKYLNSKDKHIIANQAADYFLEQLCK